MKTAPIYLAIFATSALTLEARIAELEKRADNLKAFRVRHEEALRDYTYHTIADYGKHATREHKDFAAKLKAYKGDAQLRSMVESIAEAISEHIEGNDEAALEELDDYNAVKLVYDGNQELKDALHRLGEAIRFHNTGQIETALEMDKILSGKPE